jgi:hypothetical protein
MLSWTAILLIFPAALLGQDTSGWQALTRLQPGDQVKLSLRARDSVTGRFQSWSAEQVVVETTTAKRTDVTKLERFRKGGWSRRKTVVVGALIGAGGGATFGIAVGGGCNVPFGAGPCFSRAATGAAGAGGGALLGAFIGAVIPHRRMETIYAAH